MARARARSVAPPDQIFRLPPYRVKEIYVTMAETIDWGIQLLGIPALWKSTKGAGVKVAVFDTGATPGHPDLRDAITKTKDFTRSRNGVADIQGHSTHCCGTIGARANNTGVIGVAPECELLVGKVLGDDGSGDMDTIVAGLEWAASEGAQVISMSLGAPSGSPRLQQACQTLARNGIFLVAAAGNEGPSLDTVGYPALYDEVLAVGAIDQNKKVADFSSRGAAVDIVAPGVDIISCYPPKNLAKLSGTSMATPLVAGVVALLIAHRREANQPAIASMQELIAILHRTADDLGPSGADTSYGYGLVNPTKLLAQSSSGSPDPGSNGGTGSRGLTLGPLDFTASGIAKLKAAFGGSFDAHLTIP